MTMEYVPDTKDNFVWKKNFFSKSKMAASNHIEIKHISTQVHYFGENISVSHDNGMFQGH